MIDGNWKQICVVGLGGHARTKILPAITANGQILAGIVSRNIVSEIVPKDIPCFDGVQSALSNLPSDTLFIVSSPPDAHFGQVLPLLEAGRDVLVEKPAFVSAAETRRAITAAGNSGAVLIEGFMNRYTVAQSHFLTRIANMRATAIEFVFTIPKAPADTFRSGTSVGSSNLFDMGCYLLAALSDAELPINELEIDHIEYAGLPNRELLHLSGSAGKTGLVARIGVGSSYQNSIRVTSDTASFSISPFIYGRPGLRTITTVNGERAAVEEFEDINAFEAMLGIPRREWLANQDERFDQMIEITSHLERLGWSLARYRGNSHSNT